MVNDMSRVAHMLATLASKWNITSQFRKSGVLQLHFIAAALSHVQFYTVDQMDQACWYSEESPKSARWITDGVFVMAK